MSETKEENQFSKFLDNILRSAEGLEQGRKNDSFSSIELDQISNFFTRIASNYKKTESGCLLLAQQGIDTTNTDKLLNILSKQTEKNEFNGNENIKKSEDDFNSVYRFTNAIEKCELDIFESIDQNWESLKKEVNFEPLSNSIFSKDPSMRSVQSIDAESFANAMRQVLDEGVGSKIFNPIIEIMVAWKNFYFGTDNNFNYANNRIVDYITALQYITKSSDNLDFNDTDMREALSKPSIELAKSFHENAKLYLEHSYRYQQFVLPYKKENLPERDKRIMDYEDDSDKIFLVLDDLHYQDYREERETEKRKNKKWNFIWDLIQSGLLKMISKLQNKSKKSYDPVTTLVDFLGGKPNNEHQPQHHDNQTMNKCFTYAIPKKESVFELEDQEADWQTILFYQIINNLKKLTFIDTDSNNDKLIQDIYDSNSKLLNSLNSDLPYEKPIYDIILFDFDEFVIDIIKLCSSKTIDENEPSSEDALRRLPVIAAHLALMFYNVGYLNDYPNLKVIINDLISILPMPQYADIALAYLALSRGENDKEDVIKFLLSLELNCAFFIQKVLNDVCIFNIDIYNFDKKKFVNIFNLLDELYKNYRYEARTIKILTIFDYYNEALDCLIRKEDDKDIKQTNINDVMSHINISDVSILLEVSLVLIIKYNNIISSKFEEEEEETEKSKKSLDENTQRFELILNLATRYSIYALANSDVFKLTERIKIVKSAEKIYLTILKLKSKIDITYFNAFLPMIEIAKIINAFEAKRDDEAIKIAFETKILPFNINEFDDAIKFLEVPGLKESSAISSAIEKIIMHLSKVALQFDVDTKHLKSIIEFCKYLDLDEDVLAKIIKIRIKLSLL